MCTSIVEMAAGTGTLGARCHGSAISVGSRGADFKGDGFVLPQIQPCTALAKGAGHA
jgi:hypothetical protein